MTAFVLDTSCIIAAVCSWHEHCARASAEIERRLSRRESLVCAAPALIESYSVLTRLPAPHRLSPANALELLDANFMRGRRIVALDGAATASLLRSAPENEIAGGRTYDAVIVACARKARARAILTFDADDFGSLADSSLEIVIPS